MYFQHVFMYPYSGGCHGCYHAAYVWPTYQKWNKFVEVSTTPRKLRSGRCVISTRNSVYVCTISSLLGIKYYTIINLARVWYDGLSPRERLCHPSSGFCPILLSHCQNYKIFVWKMHSLCQTGKHACWNDTPTWSEFSGRRRHFHKFVWFLICRSYVCSIECFVGMSSFSLLVPFFYK
jgi:hypothetical protein